ncbi:LexA family transcriptional regulator [Serratia marcescens]|uniref:LexA family transcriptional regulator n=1 Tax=Serratia marcescens TaxID=615 RepID=UPI0020C62F16|nr:LexA family transcriptional regulator [Serratia marcescens]
MKKRGDWLKERREELKALDKKRFSVRALAERVGITSAGVSHLENSDAMPALDLAYKLARELDRPVEWILTGVGGEQPGVPIIGTTLSGPSAEWLERNGQGFNPTEYVNLHIPGRRLYGLKVSGDPSLPRYTEGEILIVDPDADPVTGEDVVVVTKNSDGSVVKILSSQRDGKVFLDSADRSQRVIRDLDEIIFIHPIVMVAKSHTVKGRF